RTQQQSQYHGLLV
ncbi:hypothetical protein D047_1108B, partial [Vibrio parahaemolyticus VPTS-2010_2]